MIHKRIADRGQVLIIFVFAVVALVGMTGLAIDGGNIFSDRRHAQNAADTAALSGALVRIRAEKDIHDNPGLHVGWGDCTDVDSNPSTCGAEVIQAALNMAQQNGYTNNLVDSTVYVHIPPTEGPYADCSQPEKFDCRDYVEVIIDTNVNTWFARVLGVNQMHNHVAAVALGRWSPVTIPYDGMSLVSLGEGTGSCPSDFNVGGGAQLELTGGGIFVNSSNPACAYKQQSCTTTVTLAGEPPATIQVVGGWELSNCDNNPPITQSTDKLDWPPLPLIDGEPDECSQVGTKNSVDGVTTYTPGNYYYLNNGTSFPPDNAPAVLEPGVYCIHGEFASTKGVTGDGVFIYIRPGANTGIQLTGGNYNLSAPDSGEYAGYLIYQDWTEGISTTDMCTIAGGSSTSFTGLMFLPYCNLTIDGTTEPNGMNAQIIAWQVSVAGTADLNFVYDSDNLPHIPETFKTGLSQ